MSPCNTTLEDLTVDNEIPYSTGLTFHEWGLIVSAVFGLIAIVIATTLLMLHATHYSKPWEQKHIIRILFMIPIYALVSFLSYYYYLHAIYFEVLRDCYEAFAIASFFTLLCNYIAPSLHEQKVYFRTIQPKNWLLPLNWFQKCSGGQDKGPLRRPKSGLTWFNIQFIGVFQYCLVRVFFTIVSVASEAGNRYCEASLNPQFAHIWVLCFEAASVTIAMYCLIQFYYQIKEEIAEHRPLMKILCIKLVIFFSFWQSLLISFVSSANGPMQPTAHIAYPDIKVGIPAVLLCIEMAIFSIMHIFAFPWRKTYTISAAMDESSRAPGSGFSGSTPKYQGGFLGVRALADAYNPWDIIKAVARGFRWLFVGVRHRHEDSSYQMTASGPKIINRPADAWPMRPDGDNKVAMQPLSSSVHPTGPSFKLNDADDGTGDLGAGYASHPHDGYDVDHPKLSPYYSPYHSPYPESSGSNFNTNDHSNHNSNNPFEDDTSYHGRTPLRSQEDVNEYVRAGSFRPDPFHDNHAADARADDQRGLLGPR